MKIQFKIGTGTVPCINKSLTEFETLITLQLQNGCTADSLNGITGAGGMGMGKERRGKGDESSVDLKFMIFVLYLLLGSHTHIQRPQQKASTLLTLTIYI